VLLACAGALAAVLLVAPAQAPQAQEAGAPTAAPERYRAAYADWRSRLQRHDLFVGRNLLPGVRVADDAWRPPAASELRRSIAAMRTRWGRWLRTTDRGRAVLFERKVRKQVPGWARSQLRAIASCESHGDPRAVGGGGAYRGMYQFSFSTWAVVGGRGDPVAASRSEQTWRAWLLLSRHGSGHWPVCG